MKRPIENKSMLPGGRIEHQAQVKAEMTYAMNGEQIIPMHVFIWT